MFVFQEYFYPKYVGKFYALLQTFIPSSSILKKSHSSAVCLGSHRVGISNQYADIPSDLRTCVTGEVPRGSSPKLPPVLFCVTIHFSTTSEISNQCSPYPCYKEGSVRCVDGQASFTCVCKPGWKGQRCEDGQF